MDMEANCKVIRGFSTELGVGAFNLWLFKGHLYLISSCQVWDNKYSITRVFFFFFNSCLSFTDVQIFSQCK